MVLSRGSRGRPGSATSMAALAAAGHRCIPAGPAASRRPQAEREDACRAGYGHAEAPSRGQLVFSHGFARRAPTSPRSGLASSRCVRFMRRCGCQLARQRATTSGPCARSPCATGWRRHGVSHLATSTSDLVCEDSQADCNAAPGVRSASGHPSRRHGDRRGCDPTVGDVEPVVAAHAPVAIPVGAGSASTRPDVARPIRRSTYSASLESE